MLEVLVVLLLIGLLTAGGLVIGKRAMASATVQGEARRLALKVHGLQLQASASSRPLRLHLAQDEGRWRGRVEGAARSFRPFALRCDSIAQDGRPIQEVTLEIDEHGALRAPPLILICGQEQCAVPFR
jgi:hypothetical protein